MPRKPASSQSSQKQDIPAAPEPTTESTQEGLERARALGRRFLPDVVKLLAGVALSPESDAGLHTRVMAAKEIVAIAGGVPQPIPPPPPPQDWFSDSGEPS